MKRMMKKIIAALLVAISIVPFAGCFEYEQPEWLKQKLCDHVYDEEEIVREATCGRNGRVMKICSACGDTKLVTIKATGMHAFDAGVAYNDSILYTCLVCGETKMEEVNEPVVTEVQAMVGDKVVGNWFRIYANSNPIPGNNAYNSTYIKVGSYNLEFGYTASMNQTTFSISLGGGNAHANCEAVLQTRTGENERGRYVDISFTEGTFTYKHFTEDATGEITAETTISEVQGVSVYRLEIN